MSIEDKIRVQSFNKSALIRLAILFALLLLLGIWVWFMMVLMPGQSYLGQLPPLQEEEIALQNSLKRDVLLVAVEIGIRNAAHGRKP